MRIKAKIVKGLASDNNYFLVVNGERVSTMLRKDLTTLYLRMGLMKEGINNEYTFPITHSEIVAQMIRVRDSFELRLNLGNVIVSSLNLAELLEMIITLHQMMNNKLDQYNFPERK